MGKRTKLRREDLERWLDKQQATLIGRAFATNVKDRDAFIDWYMEIYEDALDITTNRQSNG